MPTQANIENTLLSASYKMALLCTANLNLLKIGNNNVSWAEARNYNRNIKALTYHYDVQDFTSSETLILYNCLNSLIGIDTTVNTIDPNYQPPNTVVIINSGATQSSIPYPAGTALPIVITDFQDTYSEYGDFPSISVLINSGVNTGLDITAQSQIIKTGIPPTTVSVYADDGSGTGVTTNDILIIIGL